MDDVANMFKKMASDLTTLSNDVGKIIENKKIEAKGKEDGKDDEKSKKHDMKSWQPVTRLRKNKEECIAAQEDPDMAFIIDKLGDILAGK